MNLIRNFPLFLTVFLTLSRCTPEFEVYAPEKEIRVVYGVLNPEDSLQYIRVARAYQVKDDAIVYGGENDLSLQGMEVRLSLEEGGAVNVWEAEEVRDFPKEVGNFVPTQTVYRFRTDGSGPGAAKLEEGKRYHLELGAPDAEDYVHAYARIPKKPHIRGDLELQNSQGSRCCLPAIRLEKEVKLEWLKDNPDVYYEIRVGMNWKDNGEDKSAEYRPLKSFGEKDLCQSGNRYCKVFREEFLLSFFRSKLPQPEISNFTYDVGDDCVLNPSPGIACSRNDAHHSSILKSLLVRSHRHDRVPVQVHSRQQSLCTRTHRRQERIHQYERQYGRFWGCLGRSMWTAIIAVGAGVRRGLCT